MKNVKSSLISICALSVLSIACVKVEAELPFLNKDSKKSNRVTNNSSKVNQRIGDDKLQLQIISKSELKLQKLAGSILNVHSMEAKKILNKLPQGGDAAKSIANKSSIKEEEETLLLGFPIGLIGEQSIFGGVITKVSDKTNETLGSLKLTDLSPLHVRPMVTMSGAQPTITLVGCASKCEEDSAQNGLINFPIVGVDQESGMVILDLSAMGQELDLITMMDPTGAYTKLRAISSATTTFDYSFSTLVFDIKTKMIPVTADPTDATAPVTEFVVRWYLKLNSAFNPAFTSRVATKGVGYFKTERSKESKITRFSTTNYGQDVKYYIKNVPTQWQPVFAKAFDNWNIEFTKIIGRNLLQYEFIDSSDPRAPELVAGDIRYNIMEWDLDNKASYGGLGPSIANQFTGETLSANVLIQGPTVISLYTKWFALSRTASALMEEGKTQEANQIIASFTRQAEMELANRSKVSFALKLGSLDMNVHAQKVELEDPMIKNHFDIVPANMSFEKYMAGYFTEMLEHELGHNLGLRHNFKGNLGAYESEDKGSVSRSIMEYLGRPYRYKSAIGLYDKMAISYGYKGEAPKHLNWFCTDEDQGSDKATLAVKSAECTKSDATSDPYSFWEERLARSIDLLIDLKSTSAPVWKLSEIKTQVEEAVTGLSAYALSAEKTASSWTNFFGKGERPEAAEGMKEFVLESFRKKLCNPELLAIIAAKESEHAMQAAKENLQALKTAIAAKTTEFGLYSSEQLKCD